MNTKIVNISLPSKLVEIIDAEATLHYESRSEYIKRALVMRLGVTDTATHPDQPKTTPQTKHDSLRDYLYKTRKEWRRDITD